MEIGTIGRVRDSQDKSLVERNKIINKQLLENSNKHLANIIISYIGFRLPFANELLYCTLPIKNDLDK